MENSTRVLFICPGNCWSTKERTALSDAINARNDGLSPTLCCIKDSFLDRFAKEYSIETIGYEGELRFSVRNFLKQLKLLRGILSHNFSLIHCYDINILFPVCYLLRLNPITPLIYTQSTLVKQSYRKIWFQLLLRRVDLVILPFEEMQSNVETQLNLSSRKIVFLPSVIRFDFHGSKKQTADIPKKVGAYISFGRSSQKTCDTIFPLLNAAHVLNTKGQVKEDLELYFYSDMVWEEFTIKEKINQYIEENALNIRVHFLAKSNIVDFQRNMDIWVGLEVPEAFEDNLLGAMSVQTPVVAPRSAISMEFLHGHMVPAGETYKSNDSRDLRAKIYKIISAFERYAKAMKYLSDEIRNKYSKENHRRGQLDLYHRLIRKRKRAYSRSLRQNKHRSIARL
jgi:glycosyltransferase involved in cell wall biosynthesis